MWYFCALLRVRVQVHKQKWACEAVAPYFAYYWGDVQLFFISANMRGKSACVRAATEGSAVWRSIAVAKRRLCAHSAVFLFAFSFANILSAVLTGGSQIAGRESSPHISQSRLFRA